ncbi:MAG: nitroreductase family protein [Candidatus Acidiferrales bacterium]
MCLQHPNYHPGTPKVKPECPSWESGPPGRGGGTGPAEASVAVFFLADLRTILERYGNRGYRAVQLEAGILGGKLYLAAYALGLAATGLTFYDDDVVEFFSPHARGKSAIFLTALGHRAPRLRH